MRLTDVSDLYAAVIVAGLASAALAALITARAPTPYGRFTTTAWGPTLPLRAGWLLMEAPALPVFWAVLGWPASPWAAVGAALWTVHYLNRSLVFPLRLRVREGSRMAAVVPASGVAVVTAHAWLYATWLASLPAGAAPGPVNVAGLVLWALGFGLLLHSEATLRALRADGHQGYRVPHGGGFELVSSPHYLGEILAFTGMMVGLGCPGGVVVLALTLANLVPRAAATHRWYRGTFPDYPPGRRALVPWVW